MDALKKLFPLSFGAKDIKSLVIAIVIYILGDAVCGVIIKILGALPLIGILFGIVGTVVGLYFLAGIVLAILDYVGVFNK